MSCQPLVGQQCFPTVSRAVADKGDIIRRYITPQLSEKLMASQGLIEGERRQVTALFVDIKGYTPLSEKLGEEATFKLMERLYELMITAVHHEAGNVRELTGDGIFALFGAPIALEDGPHRACRAAMEIQKQMKMIGDELENSHRIRPMARIGINTGPVVIGSVGTEAHMELTAVGDTINLASRIESTAEPGKVYMTETTYLLVKPYTEVTFMGERQIKGKADPQKVYRLEKIKEKVVRFDESVRRGLTPLVGRTTELETLLQHCDTAFKGQTSLVQIVGEPGVGKSRIVYELHNRIKDRKLFYVRANCTSFGQMTSFLPFIEIVKGLFLINDSDNTETVERKLVHGLELLGMDSNTSPFFLTLMGHSVENEALKGLDAKLIGDRIRESLASLILNQCRLSPLVLVIEDLHWVDLASEQLLSHIVQKDPFLPLLIICTARPSYKGTLPSLPAATVLRLEVLSRDSVERMIRNFLDSDRISDEISGLIIEKAGCNPLYTEEMARFLLESNGVIETEVAILSDPVKTIVPATVLDLLQARVDRLEEGPKAVIQTAAVIGQRFSPELARIVSGLNDAFDASLDQLDEEGLIFPETNGGKTEYCFKHALLQDVIYDNLLNVRREKLHQTIAETLERLYADRLNECSETLAHHFTAASMPGKAVSYIAMSGEKSLWMYALDEADERFRRAVSLMEATPECVDDKLWASIILNWTRVFYFRTAYKDLVQNLEKYLPRMESLGDKRALSLFLSWLAFSHLSGGHSEIGRMQAEKAYSLGLEIQDPECIANVSSALIFYYAYWVPDHTLADRQTDFYFNQAIMIAPKLRDITLIQHVYYAHVINVIMRTRFAEARSICAKLSELGRQRRDDRSTAFAEVSLAFCNNMEEHFVEGLENAERAIRLAPDYFTKLMARVAKAAALALSGKIVESAEILIEANEECERNNFLIPLAAVHMPLGAVMLLSGKMAKGAKQIKWAVRYWKAKGNYVIPVRGHAIMSDIYLRMLSAKGKMPLRSIINNFWFLLLNRPVALWKAEYHLKKLAKKSREFNMPGFLAKALYGLGVLAQIKRKNHEARSYFEEALKVAEASGLYIAAKIRAALKQSKAVT